jgi:hypothetical protein
LVGAVEVDIASEQVAAEAKLAALVKRGRLADAHRAAHAALRRTIQYGESLRHFLETARRDVRAVDWSRDINAVQREALDHIEERIHAENAIRDNLVQIIDDAAAEDAGRRGQATGLIGILDECLKRHMALQAALQRAGSVFREEQARQTFTAPAARLQVDVFGQLLTPSLGLPVASVVDPLAKFFTEVRGPARPALVYLPDVITGLMRIPAEQAIGEEVVIEPDLEDDEDDPRFTGGQYEAADRILAGVSSEGARLSDLLRKARQSGPGTGPDCGTDLLLALHVMRLFAAPTEAGTAGSLLCAGDDDSELVDPRFAGSDVLVRRITVPDGHARGGGDDDEMTGGTVMAGIGYGGEEMAG